MPHMITVYIPNGVWKQIENKIPKGKRSNWILDAIEERLEREKTKGKTPKTKKASRLFTEKLDRILGGE